jgi:hypothetical protein
MNGAESAPSLYFAYPEGRACDIGHEPNPQPPQRPMRGPSLRPSQLKGP